MALTQEDFLYLRELLREHSAIVLDDGKEYLAESRLHSLATKIGMRSSSELMKTVRLDPAHALRSKVIEAMTTNETSFFRDPHFFEMIRKQLIPRLLERRQGNQRIQIWSAACSSGQEPYSLAITLKTYFPDLCDGRVQITATDLSLEMIERAKRGLYSQLEVNRGVPATHLIRYFRRNGLDWVIDDSIRDMVNFRTMNLIQPWKAMPPQDLVLIRNVMIYFDLDSRKSILNRVASVMSPDGYLILGGSESPLFNSELFDRVSPEISSAYRLKGQVQTAKTLSVRQLQAGAG
jgi:chemotaxis protein methyltransferase CheR